MRTGRHHLSNAELLFRRLHQTGKLLRARKRQIIFSVGDRSENLFLVESGSVKLTLTSLQGKEAVVSVLHPGEFFGTNVLSELPMPCSTNAIAVTDVRAITIGREPVMRILRDQPAACIAFISCMVNHISQLNAEIGSHLLYGSEQRLARALLSMAHLHEDQESQVLPKMSQQDLASMIGITRQRVNTLLKRFRESGLIDYSGGLRVHSSIRNAARLD